MFVQQLLDVINSGNRTASNHDAQVFYWLVIAKLPAEYNLHCIMPCKLHFTWNKFEFTDIACLANRERNFAYNLKHKSHQEIIFTFHCVRSMISI